MGEYKPCSKCGSTDYYFTVDKRGVPEVRCRDCDTFIIKSGSADMYNYFQGELEKDGKEIVALQEKVAELSASRDDSAPLCKYCTERWAIFEGRMSMRAREMDDIKFCPMCGRRLKPTDKDY